MKFIYDKAVDDECVRRLAACTDIFGEKKKTEIYAVNDKIVQDIAKIWTPVIDNVFREGIRHIFKAELPDNFTCYINSTSYSMDVPGGIAISAGTKSPLQTICHETSHYMFRLSTYPTQYFSNMDIEDAKEIFTILNNVYFQDIMEGQDIGWKQRKRNHGSCAFVMSIFMRCPLDSCARSMASNRLSCESELVPV